MNKELYVLVSEHDIGNIDPLLKDHIARPIVWEQYLDQGAASLENIRKRKECLGDRYGKTRIARLKFLDEK